MNIINLNNDYCTFELLYNNLTKDMRKTKEHIENFRETLSCLFDLFYDDLTPEGIEVIEEILRCTNVVINNSNKLNKFRDRLYEIIDTFLFLIEEDLYKNGKLPF